MGSEENRKTLICSIVGDCMVGKTLICKTLTGQAMTDGYTATVSDEYTYDTFMFGEDYTIKIKDLSGQVRRLLSIFFFNDIMKIGLLNMFS